VGPFYLSAPVPFCLTVYTQAKLAAKYRLHDEIQTRVLALLPDGFLERYYSEASCPTEIDKIYDDTWSLEAGLFFHRHKNGLNKEIDRFKNQLADLTLEFESDEDGYFSGFEMMNCAFRIVLHDWIHSGALDND
jgi:hypothetical protein